MRSVSAVGDIRWSACSLYFNWLHFSMSTNSNQLRWGKVNLLSCPSIEKSLYCSIYINMPV
jgi:hypothetical protein